MNLNYKNSGNEAEKKLAISNYDKRQRKKLFGNGRRKSNSQLFAVEKREVESTKN
jgi:hypothetical protein